MITNGRTGRKQAIARELSCLMMLFLLLFPFAALAEGNSSPYERVIIFGMDGAGTMIRQGNTPNFDRIFISGSITYEALASVPTLSAQGWGSAFYGVPGPVHGETNNYAMNVHKFNVLYPSIFRLTREAYPKAKTASFANWPAINWGLIERDCGVFMFPEDRKEPAKEAIVRHVLAYLKKNDPKLLFVYFVDVDDALHLYGYGSDEYFEAMEETDKQIGVVYDALAQNGMLENTLVLFVTDHGGNNEKNHGGSSDQERKVTFAAAGPGVEEHGIIEDMELQDVAAVVLYALGIEQPEIQTGRIPKGIFPGIGGGKRKQTVDLSGTMDHYGNGVSAAELPELTLPKPLTEKLVYYQSFDGPVKGLSGEKLLSGGLLGNALNLRNSYLKTGLKNSRKWKGMTIGFWFRDDGEDGDPVFAADKNWMSGKNKGFVIAMKGDSIQINIGCGTKFRKDIIWQLPDGYRGKWIHRLAVFDQETKEISLYFNFRCAATAAALPEKHSDWASGKEIILGQDTTGKYQYRMNADMDELMVFNEALTPEEIGEIRDMYEPLFTERSSKIKRGFLC